MKKLCSFLLVVSAVAAAVFAAIATAAERPRGINPPPGSRDFMLPHVDLKVNIHDQSHQYGSGVVFRSDATTSHILTNRHVVCCSSGRHYSLDIKATSQEWTAQAIVVRLHSKTQGDIAVLQVRRPSRAVAQLAPQGYRPRGRLTLIGNPGNTKVISKTGYRTATILDGCFEVNTPIRQGMSGGGVYDSSYLVGLMSASDLRTMCIVEDLTRLKLPPKVPASKIRETERYLSSRSDFRGQPPRYDFRGQPQGQRPLIVPRKEELCPT